MTALDREHLLAASRLVGWVLAGVMVLGGAEAGLMISARVADEHTRAVQNKRDFVQRVIACRHKPGEPPRRSWNVCELEIREAQ